MVGIQEGIHIPFPRDESSVHEYHVVSWGVGTGCINLNSDFKFNKFSKQEKRTYISMVE